MPVQASAALWILVVFIIMGVTERAVRYWRNK